MIIESVLKQGGKALIQAKKAYVKPMICELSFGLKIGHLTSAKNLIEINPAQKIKSLQTRLEGVLQSPHCEMPDYMSLIPKGASEEETAALLNKMFEDSKFFSRVSTCEQLYGKNFKFAEMMSDLSSKSSQSISEGKSFKEILGQIAKGYSKETTINTEFTERLGNSGIYRGSATKPPEYIDIDGFKFRVDRYDTGYGCSGVKDGYRAYIQRLDNTGKRISPFNGFTLTEIKPSNPCMRHPYHEEVAKNMEIISERYQIFQDLVKKYNKTGTLSAEMRKQADDIISEIYFLMANTCPFKRGSNGISDVLMRSQYSALGINMPHVKKGVGLDLEAFCMELGEYKTKWNSFFDSL